MASRIAVTVGDPRGIGPEVAAKALEAMEDLGDAVEFVVLGPEALIAGMPGEHIALGGAEPRGNGLTLSVSAVEAGRLTELQVERAAAMAMAGEVDALVTGPADKSALNLAGVGFPGHTEWLAHLAGGARVAMMLASDRLRVVLVTTHLPLRDVPAALTTARVIEIGRITQEALRAWWGLHLPRLALCALNPHAGERGLFGDEDSTILAPAAAALEAAGPLPADTIFVRALKGEFDAVLAPYHDVGMTAIKVASFGQAVNVTLGLPFIRTSPDHGTALDIAGQGTADAGSMREAIRLAVRLAVKREAAARST